MDAKLPVPVPDRFLLGFLPAFLVLRGRIWGLKRRLETAQPVVVANAQGGAAPPAPPAAQRSEEERLADRSEGVARVRGADLRRHRYARSRTGPGRRRRGSAATSAA